MIARYRLAVYGIQVGAALSILVTFLLPWHMLYGRGVDMLYNAITSKIAFGLNPFDPDYIPVSQWWLIWIIPLVNIVIGFRGILYAVYIKVEPNYNRQILAAMMLLMGIIFLWIKLAFEEKNLESGFQYASISAIILMIAIFMEMLLPRKSAEEIYMENLPADHPDRLWAGEYRICLVCGEFNVPEVRTCRYCRT